MVSVRFLIFLIAFVLASLVAGRTAMDFNKSILIGFDVAALLFLVLVAPLFRRLDPATMRSHARQRGNSRRVLLVITGTTMAVILATLTLEYDTMVTTSLKFMVIITLALAWLLSNTIYALHYAHLYYRPGSKGGLVFSGDHEPDYGDFAYFAFTMGMTFATSDVTITSSEMRRSVTAHSVASFVFNIGVLAFTINVLGK